jgi:hypothetical protein
MLIEKKIGKDFPCIYACTLVESLIFHSASYQHLFGSKQVIIGLRVTRIIGKRISYLDFSLTDQRLNKARIGIIVLDGNFDNPTWRPSLFTMCTKYRYRYSL